MNSLNNQKAQGKLNGTAGVYLIMCNDEVVYVGSSLSVFKRKSNHLSLLRYNKHPVKELQELYDEFGEENLIFTVMLQTILEEDNDKLYELEARVMEMFQDSILNKDKVVKKYKYIRSAEESRKFRAIMSEAMSGERNPNNRLSENDARTILELKEKGVKISEIAEIYEISDNHIYAIGKTRWKCIVR